MSGYLLWLIIVVAVVILIPLAVAVIRSIDYKRQISGQRKARTLKEGEHGYGNSGGGSEDEERTECDGAGRPWRLKRRAGIPIWKARLEFILFKFRCL